MRAGWPARHGLTWIGAVLIAGAGLYHVGLLLHIFAGRVGYPLDVEWMEGGMLCHALRVLEGEPIYAAPSADFIAYLYTPLYPYVVGMLGKLFGLSYALGRAVSIVSFAWVLVLAALAVWRESGRDRQALIWGVGAAGLVASSFPLCGAWYDLVRNDSLFLALITSSLYLLRFHHRRWIPLVGAGVCAGLAFLTKQTASLFIVYSGLALLLLDWRRLPVHVAVVGIVAGGSTLALNAATGGWYWRYIYEMHQGHDLYWERIWPETELTLLGFFPAVGAVMLLWLVAAALRWIRTRRVEARDRGLLFWLALALTGVLVAAVGFATQWASHNAYIPGLVFPSIFAAMAASDLARRWGSRGRVALVSVVLSIAAGGALCAQLGVQRYPARRHIPGAHDRRTGADLIATLRRIDGPVLMPYHPYYPRLAGKRTSYHQMGVNDVTRAGHAFPRQIMERVEGRHYAAIVLDNPPRGRYDFVLAHYKLGRYLRAHEVPRVYTGYPIRPTYMYVPRGGPEPVPAGARRVFGFEEGNYNGWSVEGTAFGQQPATGSVWDQGPVGPFEGNRLASSYHGGDAARGRLLSPEFLIDRPVLSYRIGGGRRVDELRMRLVDGERVLHEDTGTGTDIMSERHVDVSEHVGTVVRLELVDRASGGWGHLVFDDLMLRSR